MTPSGTESKRIPVGKIAVCRSVFLIMWHGILSAELTKTSPSDYFLAILPTGKVS